MAKARGQTNKRICGTEGNNMNERRIIKEGREGEEEEVMAVVNHG